MKSRFRVTVCQNPFEFKFFHLIIKLLYLLKQREKEKTRKLLLSKHAYLLLFYTMFYNKFAFIESTLIKASNDISQFFFSLFCQKQSLKNRQRYQTQLQLLLLSRFRRCFICCFICLMCSFLSIFPTLKYHKYTYSILSIFCFIIWLIC